MTAPIPVPDDFVENSKVMNRSELLSHYNVCSNTITRWRKVKGMGTASRPISQDEKLRIKKLAPKMNAKEIGIIISRPTSTIAKFCARNNISILKKNSLHKNKPVVPMEAGRHRTQLQRMMADLAAYSRCPVFRCDKDGKPNPQGNHVVYGRTLKTQDEIEQMCRRKGLFPYER